MGRISREKWFNEGRRVKFERMSSIMNRAFSSIPNVNLEDLSADKLALLAYRIDVWFEKHCGEGSPSPRPLDRLSGWVLDDMDPSGALEKLLGGMLRYKFTKHPERDFELESADQKAVISLIKRTVRMLLKSGIIAQKRVYFDESISSQKRSLLAYQAQILNANVVEMEEMATHVITANKRFEMNRHTDCVVTPNKGSFRVIEKDSDQVKIHWIHLPSSQDEWVKIKEYAGSENAPMTRKPGPGIHKNRWYLSDKYMYLSYKYNEWMVEDDFEMVPLSSKKRSINESKSTDTIINKKKMTLKLKKTPSIMENEIENKKQQRMIVNMDDESYFPYSGPLLTRIESAQPVYPIAIPSYSQWFDMDQIHPLELDELRSLFQFKNVDFHSRYLEIRNFIINCFRLNPRVYLSATAVRRMMAADAGAVIRIHAFLQEWGLINYACDEGTHPMISHCISDDSISSLIKCMNCSKDCSRVHYQLSMSDLIICKDCLDNEEYPCVFDASDFELRETSNVNTNTVYNKNNDDQSYHSVLNDVSHPILGYCASVMNDNDEFTNLVRIAENNVLSELNDKSSASVIGSSAALSCLIETWNHRCNEALMTELITLQSEAIRIKMDEMNEISNMMRDEMKSIQAHRVHLIRQRIRLANQKLELHSHLAADSAVKID